MTDPTDGSPPAAPLSVFGLGYVGCVSAACFAARGHRVVGVDVNEQKLELLRAGTSPVVESQLDALIAAGVDSGRLTVTSDAEMAVAESAVILVCVGTPSDAGGSPSTMYLERACEQIGIALGLAPGWRVVVFRSTMLPGTCTDVLVPILERASGRVAGVDFGVCVNPEYLREGSSVRDFAQPPKTVVGESDERSGATVMALYDELPGPRFRVSIRTAEMSKYVDNSFHAVKVAYANEIGAVCQSLEIDSHEVMELFLADTKLNLGPAYLRPGFAFGGSCLPKDVRGLVSAARRRNVDVPLLAHLLPSNEAHIRRAVDLVLNAGCRRVAMLGLSFKPGTDDLRESPLVELAERLIGKGFDLRIYDPTVARSTLIGANRDYVTQRLPHIGQLLSGDLEAVVKHGDACVVGRTDPGVADVLARTEDRLIIDLVRMPERPAGNGASYVGICW